ncbi:MAG: hypothetical protein RXP86_10955 [Acidilobus sp.]
MPELGTLPPELRLSPSDVKLILRCYKAGAEGLVDVIFVIGNALLSPLLAFAQRKTRRRQIIREHPQAKLGVNIYYCENSKP